MGDPDLLGARKRGQALRRGRSAAISSIVPGLPAPKALSFLHVLSSLDLGEFGQGDSVHIHGIRIVVRARWGMYLGGNSSFLQGEDVYFLGMEDLGLIDPPFDGRGDGGHGQDHISDFLV